MLKKIFFLLVFLGIGLFWYFYQKSKVTPSFTDIEKNNPLVVFTPPTKEKIAIINKPITPAPAKVFQGADENFSQFDQIEKTWLLKMASFFNRNDYDFYNEIRNRNEEEKMEAYKEFHDYLRKKNGDNFSYHISEDQSVREKAINNKYSQVLLKRIGPEKFKMYLKTRDQFNEDLARNAPSGRAMIIEF
jgi:hypothetical protein